jgi:hypothetical protein
MLLIVIASGIFVYFDAKSIGVHKGLIGGFFDLGVGGWTAVTLLLWIIGFPSYLIKRGALKEAAKRERAVTDAQTTTAASPPPGISASAIDALEKLAVLRDRGVLTSEEFEKKKREILA